MANGQAIDWYSTNFTNVTGVGNFIQTINYQVNGFLGYGFLFIIFILTFGFSMVSGSRKALLTSCFITFLFSIYFMRMSIINPIVVLLLIIGIIIGAIGSKSEGNY